MKKKKQSVIIGILVILIGLMTVELVFMIAEERNLSQQEHHAKQESPLNQSESIEIYLPEVFYAKIGIPLEIYNSQITNLGKEISRYNVLWSCDLGKNMERRYSLLPEEGMAGEYELTVSIYDNALNLLASRTSVLKVSETSDAEENAQLQKLVFPLENEKTAEESAEEVLNEVQKICETDSQSRVYAAVYGEDTEKTLCVLRLIEENLPNKDAVVMIPAAICIDMEYNYDYETGGLNKAGEAQLSDLFLIYE